MSTKNTEQLLETLFSVGAHYAFSKSRRHPSSKQFIFGAKNGTEIFDLEKTIEQLEEVKKYVEKLTSEGKTILFVSSKPEARQAIIDGATKAGQPYVTDRWVGGTLTNFSQMRKRVQRLEDLKKKREKGELSMYTKKEKLLIDREIESLEERFGGITELEGMPAALFIVDTRDEPIAVHEAHKKNIPIIALIGSDCDATKVTKAIFANDSARKSIDFFVNEIAESCKKGSAQAPRKVVTSTGATPQRSSVVISRAREQSEKGRGEKDSTSARFVRAQPKSGDQASAKPTRSPRTLRA